MFYFYFYLGHAISSKMRLVGNAEVNADVHILHGVRMYLFLNGKVDDAEGPGFQIRPGAGNGSLTYGHDFRTTVAGNSKFKIFKKNF